jgi:glycosyltransferase involved in cell wall biosynthesis
VPVLKNVPQSALRRLLNLGLVRLGVNGVLALWVAVLRLLLGFASRDVLLYVSNVYYGRILPFLPRRAALYDCNDNHLAFPGTPHWARGYFERVVTGVDAVVISQPLLREEIEPLRRQGIVEIGNGVDFELFDRAWASPTIPMEIGALPSPRIGYAGALAEWLDFSLFEHLASRFSQASLVLVGPAVGSDAAARLAATHANVHWLGPKPHAELPHFVAAMDVCLIPFRLTPLTRGVNPNKLYEYFALGKPVVSTDFSPYIREFEPLVHVGRTPEEVAERVSQSLQTPGDAEARRAVAREHGWDRAAAAMRQLCERLVQSAGKRL